MRATSKIPFDVELSAKEIAALGIILEGKCEVQKIATLIITVVVPLKDKLPTPEARNT